jgi:tetrahydromethanopterin S-methyltransferase subunit D
LTVAGNALVVGVPGVYFVSGMIDWAVNGTGGRSLSLARNGSSLGAADLVQAVPATFGNTLHSVSALARFNAGDTITLHASQGSGGSLNTAVVGNSANLSAVWISP